MNIEWQPIETAPKDRRILLGFPRPVFEGANAVFGRWEDQKHHKRPRPYWTHDLLYLNGIMAVRSNQPTHWAPNIEPPPVLPGASA